MAREAKDKRVKAMIQYILEDEKRHHSTLQALSNLMDQDNAAFEEYLELFQKYMVVPSRG
jgi:rubrerythrin